MEHFPPTTTQPTQDDSFCFFTIGYQGKSFDTYLHSLMENNIKLLCDVRKNPVSRKQGFSKTQLTKTLKNFGIEYVHIPELGIPSQKRRYLRTQQAYERLFKEYENTILKNNSWAIDRLYQIFLDKKRIAITCFEADVCMCHRGRIVNALTKLQDWKYEIQHL
ncbi:Uncharacterized conserved protein [Candidatus Bartonella washoeensis]|uniref:DUF488 domain-containing protein n=1 Tax=Candidatus Bartonella washoeensis Sb944nv TaxID=1094563 RepID=J1J5C6_9HYPH|nr:DUF488 domain-containing protein [Bartonella washoeensis]EJF78900.1 hypothetical protein MCQ_00941 [Bartonella washoeensis Sb944nv]SPU26552.1 Uncharacterized conserved protein [Bartonella washoeensis]